MKLYIVRMPSRLIKYYALTAEGIWIYYSESRKEWMPNRNTHNWCMENLLLIGNNFRLK